MREFVAPRGRASPAVLRGAGRAPGKKASRWPCSFLFFHKRLCGPLANSRFHHQPDPQHRPNSRLEAAYHRADTAIQRVVDLVAAA